MDEKTCPKCGGTVMQGAVMCKHCGHRFAPEERSASAAQTGSRGFNKTAIGFVVAVCLALAFCVNHASNQLASDHQNAVSAIAAAQGSLDAANRQITSMPTSLASPDANWTYSDDEDKMRGQIAHFATSVSTNAVDLPFPYSGDGKANLVIRHRAQDGLHAILHVEGSQILCSSYSPSHLSMKFDSSSVERFECTDSNDGNSGIVYLESSSRFVSQLRKAKHLMIEAQMYGSGPKQWEFDVSGLHLK